MQFNPFDLVIKIAQRLWPELDCDIYFTDSKQLEDADAKALTVFPDDGGRPEICISPEAPVYGAVELMAHELAHVVAGESSEAHGKEWDDAFTAIHEAYGAEAERLIDGGKIDD